MSRWRPPAPKSSPYITPAGYAVLEKELASLWKKRRIVNDALSAAAAEGAGEHGVECLLQVGVGATQAVDDRRSWWADKEG